MSRLLFALSVLFFSPKALVGQAASSTTASISDTLLTRAQEWVDTWNDKDVKRMRVGYMPTMSPANCTVSETSLPRYWRS